MLFILSLKMEKEEDDKKQHYKTVKTKKMRKDTSHIPKWQLDAREEKKKKISKKLIYFEDSQIGDL